MSEIGIVVIGRNEGDRLRICLTSVSAIGTSTVYVDSGSSDDSVSFARSIGVDVVELDMSTNFTAARARNAGFDRLLEIDPDIRYVQFVDGDCEIRSSWLETARQTMDAQREVVVVCGRLRERFPERTIYNLLAELEWDTPVGLIKSCGGIFMVRSEAFQSVGLFNPTLIAGEEGELCFRLRQAGGKILRLGTEMALHDMAMTRFSQWWKRSIRTGFVYAEGVYLYGRSSERYLVGELKSVIFWGGVVPFLAVALAWPTRGLSLGLFVGYAILFRRIVRYGLGRGWTPHAARAYAAACVIGKLPLFLGSLRFLIGKLARKQSTLIEHKAVLTTTSTPRS